MRTLVRVGIACTGVIARGSFRLLLAEHANAIRQRHRVSQLMAWPLLPAFIKQPAAEPKAEVRTNKKCMQLILRKSLSL